MVLRMLGVSLGIFGKGHYRNSLECKSSAVSKPARFILRTIVLTVGDRVNVLGYDSFEM